MGKYLDFYWGCKDLKERELRHRDVNQVHIPLALLLLLLMCLKWPRAPLLLLLLYLGQPRAPLLLCLGWPRAPLLQCLEWPGPNVHGYGVLPRVLLSVTVLETVVLLVISLESTTR